MKFPRRPANKAGLRPRSHLSAEDRRVFDALAKQEYYDIMNDVDGNDRPNLMGILTGNDIPAVDAFFNKVYQMMVDFKKQKNTSGAAGGSASDYGESGDPNVLFHDSDEEEND